MDLRALAATVDRIVGETGKVDTASLHAQLFAIHQALRSSDRATISTAQPAVEQALSAVLKGKVALAPPLCVLVGKCYASIFENGDSRNMYTVVGELQQLPVARNASNSTRVCAVTALGEMALALKTRLSSDMPGTITMLSKVLKSTSQPDLRHAAVVALRQTIEGAGEGSSGSGGGGTNSTLAEAAKSFARVWSDRLASIRMLVPQCAVVLAENSENFSAIALEPLLQLAARGVLQDGSPAVIDASASATGAILALSVYASKAVAAAEAQAKIEAARGSSGGAGDEDDDSKSARKASRFGDLAASVSAFKGKDKSSGSRILDFAGCLSYLDTLWHKVSSPDGYVGVTLAVVATLRELDKRGGGNNMESQVAQRLEETLTFLLGRLTKEAWLANDCEPLLVRAAVSQALRGMAQRLPERAQASLVEMLLARLSSKGDAGAGPLQQLSILTELSQLFTALGDACPDPDAAMSAILPLLESSMHPLRFEAALALGALSRTALSLPAKLLELTLDSLDSAHAALIEGATDNSSAPSQERRAATRTRMFPLHGFGATASLLLLALPGHRLGVPPALLERALATAASLIGRQYEPTLESLSGVRLTCTRAGWTLAAALAALRPHSARSSSGKATTSVAAGDQEQPTGLLPALVRLWGRVFAGPSPEVQRTEREPTHELVRLEAALLALNSFIRSSTTFVTDRHHLLQRVVYWLTAVQKLTQTGWVSSPAKPRGQATLLRIRTLLMEAFALLPPSSYEEQHLHLVHMAIEHLTIDPLPNATSVSSPRPTEGGQTPCGWAITRTSLLHSLLHRVDDCLESCSTTHSTAGALLRMEPDSFSWRTLYMMSHATAMSEMEVEAATFGAAAWWSSTTMIARLQARQTSPRGTSSFALHSLPLHGCTLTRAVDAAVSLFCIVFCALPQEHLDGTAKLLAVRARDAEATRSRSQDKCDSAGCPVTYNVITALLGAIRELPSSSSSSTADTDNSWILVLCGAPNSLLCALLSSPISTLRRASAQALGALARKMSPDFTHKMVAMLGGRLKSKEGVTPEGRAGTVFALTCLKRASGGRATINPSLVYKQTNETMQPARNWVLHSWCLVVESVSVGAGFEQYVRSTISLVDAHLLAPVNHAAAAWEPALMGCLVRLLNVLLAALGPEADGYPDLIRRVRTIFNFLRDCCDSRVRAECMQLLEHLVLFAPSAVDRAATLSYILNALQPSSHEALSGGEATRRVRSSAIACLCRLAERDRTVVTRGFCSEKDEDGEKESALSITAVLFRALDDEIGGAGWRAAPVWRGLACPRVLLGSTADDCSRAYLRDMKTAIMEMVDMDGGVEGRPVGWILLFRALLSGGANVSSNAADSDEGGRFGVWAHARTQAAENAVAHGALRWRTRLVALQCARQVLHLLRSADDKGPHFDVTKGREAVTLALQQDGVTVETCPNFLSLHLEELVSMACNAAAASSDDQELYTLQSTGVTLLQDVVSTFVRIPDPDADAGEGVLEQYQAQISSALRRALTNSAACPELLSPACALLATGVQEKLLCDLVMLKRSIKTLMPSPLDDVVTVPSSGSYGMATDAHLHIGRVGTLARLLLAAKVVKCSDGKNDHEAQPAKWQVGLLAVLKPSLSALRQHWISIMHDYLQLQLDDGELGISNDTCSKGTFFGASGATRRIRDKLTDMFSTVAKAVALTFAGDDVDGKTSQFGFVISALLWQLQRSLAQQDDPDSVICLDSLCTMLCSPLLRVEHLAAAACVELIAIVDAAANEQPSLDVRTSAHALLEALTLNGGRGATYLSETFSAGDEAGTELLRAIVRVVCRAFHEELKHQPTGSDNNAQGRVLTLAHAPLVQSMLNLVPPASRAAFYGPLMQLFVRVVNAAAVEDGPSEALSTALQSISCCITAACGTGDDALANTLLHATLNSVGTELEGADEKVLLPALLQLLQTLVLAAPASLMVTGSTVFARFVELWREVLTANSQHKRLAALRSFSSTLQATLRDDESNGGVGRRLLGAIGGHIWVATQMDTSDSETAAEGAKLLLLATTQCPVEQQASMLSSVLLPVLLQLLRHEPGSVTKQVAVQCVTAVLARSPLPFKQAIVTLAPQERSLLETELRAAMAARAQASAGSSSANAPKKLSLKRFTSA